jgi:hypothetical protein
MNDNGNNDNDNGDNDTDKRFFFLQTNQHSPRITKWLAGGERPPPKAMIPISPFSALCL